MHDLRDHLIRHELRDRLAFAVEYADERLREHIDAGSHPRAPYLIKRLDEAIAALFAASSVLEGIEQDIETRDFAPDTQPYNAGCDV